jgi:hypothetical protein
MNTIKVAALRKQVDELFRNNQEGSTIEFVLNGEVKGSYKIPQNHYVEPDSKTPRRWFDLLLCFEVDMKGLKRPKVELRVKR